MQHPYHLLPFLLSSGHLPSALMPSPHHHHHSQTSQCCCCCCSSNCCLSNTSPPPPLTTSDHLLQALATQLLLHSQPQFPSLPSLYSHQPLKPQQQHQQQQHLPPLHPLFQDHHRGDPCLPPLHDQQQQQQLYHYQSHPLIHSLLHRVAALESSFPHLSSSASPPPPPPPTVKHLQRRPLISPPPPPTAAHSYSSSAPSLRDLAARRIQASFRRFLLRRSQTLRDLKDLAAMKSHVAALRSALSDKTHVDPKALSERAMDLLLRLDAIQSGDPMIREGKRSISRELVRMLEFIDKVLVKEHQLSLDAIEIAGNGGNERSFVEDRRREGEGAEEVLRVAKKVSFLEDGKRSVVSSRICDQFAEELRDAGDQNAPLSSLGIEVARKEVRDHPGTERFHEISDDERSSESSVESGGRYETAKRFQNRNGNLGLSAPLPIQMEPRRK